MVHKRTPYTRDALKYVKILSAFNASGDVKIFILTHASFHLLGGLIACDIITTLFMVNLAMICYLICNKQ